MLDFKSKILSEKITEVKSIYCLRALLLICDSGNYCNVKNKRAQNQLEER